MKRDLRNIIIVILAILLLVTVAILAYIFLVKPSITGFAVKYYNQGVQDTVNFIAQKAAQCQQPVALPVGNQTVEVISTTCLSS